MLSIFKLKEVDKFAVENLPDGLCSWVTKYKFLYIIPIFKVTFNYKETKYKGWSLFCPKGKKLKGPVKTDSTVYITEEEFQKDFNGNKWKLPLNYQIKE